VLGWRLQSVDLHGLKTRMVPEVLSD